MTDRGRGAAWRPQYEAERDRLLLARLRGCLGLTLFGMLVSAMSGDGAGVVFLALYTGLVAVGWFASQTTPARENAIATAVGYMLVVAVATSFYFVHVPTGGELGPVAAIATVMALTMLLPWGAVPQAIVAAAHFVGCCGIVFAGTGSVNVALLGLVLTAVAVSVVGAELIERYRETSFLRTWQQAQLVGLARDLAQHVEVQEVARRVLELGMPALAADGAALATCDPRRGVYRIEAHSGEADDAAEWWTGLEVPQDYAPLCRIIEHGTLELPTEDPSNEVVPVIASQGVRRLLFVTMRHGSEVLGILCFLRRSDEPFEAADRQLAGGFADQTALALRTANVIADLQRASRLKSEFVSTMSHELRTPLNVILGFTDMLDDTMFGETEKREFTQHIRQAGLELLELIENTLAVGKFEVGREDVQLERVSLRAFWAEVGRTCADLPRSNDASFEWSDAVPELDFRTDPRKLSVVIRNLVGNALKFTPRGRVRCTVWLAGENLVFRISDTGIGIRPEDHEAIFEMFRQGDSRMDSRRFGGTGLGLYIVRRFVGQLAGRVTLESAPGQGSVFSVILPRSAAPPSISEAA